MPFPPPRKMPNRLHLKLQPAITYLDRILDRDRNEPRKQRHTAHKILRRVKHEFPDLRRLRFHRYLINVSIREHKGKGAQPRQSRA
jgi:hypothetical protein